MTRRLPPAIGTAVAGVSLKMMSVRTAGRGAKVARPLQAANEPATLANLTNAIAKQEGAVTNLKIQNRQADFLEVLVDVDVRDLKHLSNVIAGLRAAPGITQVERARA